MVERYLAILLKVELDWLTVSESLLTLPPFACAEYYSSNNILNKSCSGIMSYFMQGLQALAGIRSMKEKTKEKS